MKYALITEGKVTSVHHGDTPPSKGNYLPIEDDFSIDFTDETKEFISKPRKEWVVESDKVIKTYLVEDKNLDEEKKNALNKIKDIRDENIQKGFSITINGQDITFPADEVTISRVDQASLDAERRPTNWSKRWKLADGQWVNIDATMIEHIRETGADFIEANFQKHENLESQILSASSVSEISSIDVESNWPQ